MEARTLGLGISALALAVFGGFVMYSLEVDSLESKLNKQKIELAKAQSDLDSSVQRGERAQKRVEEARSAKRAAEQEETEMKEKRVQVEAEAAALALKLEGVQKAIVDIAAQKVSAAAKIREQALDESFGQLTLATGRVLQSAKLRKISPDSLSFSHSQGSVTVAWRDLPPALVERFQLQDIEVTEQEAHAGKEPVVVAAQGVSPAFNNTAMKAAADKVEQLRLQIEQAKRAQEQWRAKETEYQQLHSRAQLLGRSSSHLIKAEEARKKGDQLAGQIDRLERQILQTQQEAVR